MLARLLVMLPLCLLQDLTLLEKYSLLKISLVLPILSIVVYIYTTDSFTTDPLEQKQQQKHESDVYHHWLGVCPS